MDVSDLLELSTNEWVISPNFSKEGELHQEFLLQRKNTATENNPQRSWIKSQGGYMPLGNWLYKERQEFFHTLITSPTK